MAALLNAAQGARAIGVDVLMPDRDRLSPDDLIRRHHIEAPALRDALLALPQPDTVLAAALRAQPTVLAMAVGNRNFHHPNAPVPVDPVRGRGISPAPPCRTTAARYGRFQSWRTPLARLASLRLY
jgi:hypothetical protein